MLPDVAAAVLLSPTVHGAVKQPRVNRALRLVPAGPQEDLNPVGLRGGHEINPLEDDPFIRMIEERQHVLRDKTLDEEERARIERFLKITANATAYGILARLDRREQPAPVTVYGPDDEPIEPEGPVANPEDPGPFCFPPVAAAITPGARLMLALLERVVHDAGGSYAFCDTDSMAIVASKKGRQLDCLTAHGTSIRALSRRDVRQILDRFDDLNPYDRKLVASPWRVEADSLTRELWCYAISAKRYCLYRPTAGGSPEIIAAIDDGEADTEDGRTGEDELEDWSEHGLGLYLDPTASDPERPRRDNNGRRLWVAQAWQWIIDQAAGLNPTLPPWASTYALTRFTISSPALEAWFTGYNQDRPRDEHIRPGSFGLIAHPITLHGAGTPRPTAPYEKNPARWPKLGWYDRRSGRKLQVVALDEVNDPEARAQTLARGDIPIQTLQIVLGQYRRRPEHKSLAPDGGPTGAETTGLLRRRTVISSPVRTELLGKRKQ
jgi:hypothetical protein